jgi:hypothetical protein
LTPITRIITNFFRDLESIVCATSATDRESRHFCKTCRPLPVATDENGPGSTPATPRHGTVRYGYRFPRLAENPASGLRGLRRRRAPQLLKHSCQPRTLHAPRTHHDGTRGRVPPHPGRVCSPDHFCPRPAVVRHLIAPLRLCVKSPAPALRSPRRRRAPQLLKHPCQPRTLHAPRNAPRRNARARSVTPGAGAGVLSGPFLFASIGGWWLNMGLTRFCHHKSNFCQKVIDASVAICFNPFQTYQSFAPMLSGFSAVVGVAIRSVPVKDYR